MARSHCGVISFWYLWLCCHVYSFRFDSIPAHMCSGPEKPYLISAVRAYDRSNEWVKKKKRAVKAKNKYGIQLISISHIANKLITLLSPTKKTSRLNEFHVDQMYTIIQLQRQRKSQLNWIIVISSIRMNYAWVDSSSYDSFSVARRAYLLLNVKCLNGMIWRKREMRETTGESRARHVRLFSSSLLKSQPKTLI